MTRKKITKAKRQAKAKSLKLVVILNSGGAERDRKTTTVKPLNDDLDEGANLAIHDIIDGWRLYAGDSITIETVPA